MRKTLLLLLTLALPAFVAAQEEDQGLAAKKPVVIPAAEKAKLARLLPEPRLLSTTAEAPRFYASDLYRYLDGGAEIYHVYDMVAMVHREYKAKDTDLTVDIFDMASALNAFGIYAAERSSDYHFIEVGAEGYSDPNILNFLQGPFYVKLSAFSDTQKAGPALRSFADDISRRIGAGKRLPELLSLFPAQNLVAHSQKFVKRAPLGHEFLAPAFSATYSFAGQESTLLISTAAGAAQSQQRANLLKKHFAKTGKAADEPAAGAGACRGSNSVEGEMIFFPCGRFTVVFVNPPPDAGAFLKEVVARVSKEGTSR